MRFKERLSSLSKLSTRIFNKQDNFDEEWFTIESIEETNSIDRLYCISVDSEEKQFQIGELGIPTHNTEEAKALDELKGESTMIIL